MRWTKSHASSRDMDLFSEKRFKKSEVLILSVRSIEITRCPIERERQGRCTSVPELVCKHGYYQYAVAICLVCSATNRLCLTNPCTPQELSLTALSPSKPPLNSAGFHVDGILETSTIDMRM